MKIIVHLGMPKTGSTSIQQTLYKNKDKLETICYPDFYKKENHQWLLKQAFESSPNKSGENPELDSVAFEKNQKIKFKQLKNALDSSVLENRDVLLSAETLCLNLNVDELKRLRAFLRRYTNEIIAVAYVRTPKSYIESAFQQTLKHAVLSKTKHSSRIIISQRFPRYQTLFEKFDLSFGKKNVHFWKFDPSTFPNQCVVTDFCQRLNIDIAPESILKINEGISLGTVSLLYAYLTYGKKSSFSKKALFDLLCQYQDGKKLRFSSEIIAPLLEENKTQIKWMEKRAGISLAEDIYKDDLFAIHSDADLFAFTPETIQWLATQLGKSPLDGGFSQITPQELVQWMESLVVE